MGADRTPGPGGTGGGRRDGEAGGTAPDLPGKPTTEATPRRLTTTLHRTPRPRLLARFAAADLRTFVTRAGRLTGRSRPPADYSPAELPVPDSPACRDAVAHAAGLYPRAVLEHGLRTYRFGLAIGLHRGLRVDREVLLLGSLLHDLGLVAVVEAQDPRPADSFELVGARSAAAYTERLGFSRAAAATVHEAVALHAAVGIADKLDPEIALVHLGAGIDVIGFGAIDVSAATIAAVVGEHPRLEFKSTFTALVLDQGERKPDSHIAGHLAMGFARRIRDNRLFDE